MPIFLVDKNVVITCKQKLNGQRINLFKKRALRKLNKPYNQISPLLSIIEGSKGRKESRAELEKNFKEETSIIKSFFKKAHTDSDFLNDNFDEFIEVFTNNSIEDNESNYKKFISEMDSILFQPIARNKRKQVTKEILEIANNYNIDTRHIIVQCVLAVLYGNNDVRRIFKFKNSKEKNSHNAYNDIMFCTRVARLIYMKKQIHPQDEVTYFTFDKALEKLFKSIKIEVLDMPSETEIEFKTTFNKSFFKDLNEEEIEKLIEEIENNSLSNIN